MLNNAEEYNELNDIVFKPVKCYRCGSCCGNFSAMVPASETSDLSPDFLEKLRVEYGDEYVMTYFDEHAMFQGERCEWLINETDGSTTCSLYEMRGSDCRNYPDPTAGSTYCRVGKLKMERITGTIN